MLDLFFAASHVGTPQGMRAVDELAAADATLVEREAERQLLTAVGVLWRNGWQPAELLRLGRRADGRLGRLVAASIAADHVLRHPTTLHPRWAAQVATLDLPTVAGATGWLGVVGATEWPDRTAFILAVVLAIDLLSGVAPLHIILPPPGTTTTGSLFDADPMTDDPVLVRVRALLAQAESTTFVAEAEAFTAKAQELMARHAIDAAVVWATTDRTERPTTIRVPIDDPYADIKSLLLQFVAGHSRCKAAWISAYAMSTVVGFASDVASTEMLFTSLLVQSQTALQAEGAKAGPGARVRSRAFRSSFLMAFTHRINQRLTAINAAVEREAEAEAVQSLLPALVSRQDAVKDAADEVMGPIRSAPVRGGSDASGWISGTLAADLAKLNVGDLTAPPAALTDRSADSMRRAG